MAKAGLTKRERAAIKVVELARARVLVGNPFLAGAVGKLRLVPGEFIMPLATNGRDLGVDPVLVCDAFLRTKEPPTHDFLHAALHCVFLHPYTSDSVERGLWDVACDIAVEAVLPEICGAREGVRGEEIEAALATVRAEIGTHVGAEKVYRRLRLGEWANEVGNWKSLFAADDHAYWYLSVANDDEGCDSGASGTPSNVDGGNVCADRRKAADGSNDEGLGERKPTDGSGDGESDGTQDGAPDSGELGSGSANSESADGSERGSCGAGSNGGSAHDACSDIAPAKRRQAMKRVAQLGVSDKEGWRRTARSISVDLHTCSKGQGMSLGGLVKELEDVSNERVDYGEFLRRFTTPTETLKVSEDEFDYVFYTYGLKLYGNLPLIEPLEYCEPRRIREFVIAIDTSGSVWGALVDRFIKATFGILKSTDQFSDRMRVHIVQCDVAVRSHDVITSQAELDGWRQGARCHGGGGTDFRPVFLYVDELIEKRAIGKLDGLIYFTDGFGFYPESMPSYKTAFVFYGDDCYRDDVPLWAAQAVLDEESIASIEGIDGAPNGQRKPKESKDGYKRSL